MDGTTFGIDVEHTAAGLRFSLRGELDLATAQQALAAFERDVDGRPEVIVDLSGLTFMDSAGIRLLLQMHGRQEGRRVRFARPSAQVGRILDLAGIRPVFDWVEDTGAQDP
jgi:anti-sigma B factor antagonist